MSRRSYFLVLVVGSTALAATSCLEPDDGEVENDPSYGDGKTDGVSLGHAYIDTLHKARRESGRTWRDRARKMWRDWAARVNAGETGLPDLSRIDTLERNEWEALESQYRAENRLTVRLNYMIQNNVGEYYSLFSFVSSIWAAEDRVSEARDRMARVAEVLPEVRTGDEEIAFLRRRVTAMERDARRYDEKALPVHEPNPYRGTKFEAHAIEARERIYRYETRLAELGALEEPSSCLAISVETISPNESIPDDARRLDSYLAPIHLPSELVVRAKLSLDIEHDRPSDLKMSLWHGKTETWYTRKNFRPGTWNGDTEMDVSSWLVGRPADSGNRLEITDLYKGNTGTLKSWGLDMIVSRPCASP